MTMRLATFKETKALQQVVRINAQIAKLAQRREKLFLRLQKLMGDDAVLAVVTVDGATETRTMKVGRPKGKYVFFPDLGLVVNRRTTKADLAGRGKP